MNLQMLAQTIAKGIRAVYKHPETRTSMAYTGFKLDDSHLVVRRNMDDELAIVIHEGWTSGYLNMPIGD